MQIEVTGNAAVLHAKTETFEAWSTISREGLGEALRDVTCSKARHASEWPSLRSLAITRLKKRTP